MPGGSGPPALAPPSNRQSDCDGRAGATVGGRSPP